MRQNILITGASSGLGMEMARQFARMGRTLALCARRLDRLEALKAELAESAPQAKVLIRALDVTHYDDVFEVFRAFKNELGHIDRVIVNAGVGKGQSLGTGHFSANLNTVQTNFVGALAQCEAALEIFRAQNDGHLVTVSSVTAVRGMPRNVTAYAASKAALTSLSEGIRIDVMNTPIRVTTLQPGYIDSEMTARTRGKKFMIVDTVKGCRALIRAMEQEVDEAFLPAWPWAIMARVLEKAPRRFLAKF